MIDQDEAKQPAVDPGPPSRDSALDVVGWEILGYLIFGALLVLGVALAPDEYRWWITSLGVLCFLAVGWLLIVRTQSRRRGGT